MSESTCLTKALIIFLTVAAIVAAQETRPALVGDPTKPAEKPATRPIGPLPPLVFKAELPATPIGAIDTEPVTQADLLRFLLKGNWATVTQTLILAGLLELELDKAGIKLTEEEINEEQNKILQRLAPGKSVDEIKKTGAFSQGEMYRQAWLSRGWDRIFMAENKLQPQNQADNTNMILKQLFIRQKMEKYEVRQRGQEPAPGPGLIAEIIAKEGGATRKITADDALVFLMGLVKPGSLRDATTEVIDSKLVDRELARTNKQVTEEQVETWAASMQEKYKPPFDWRMICQFKGTSPDAERERYRRLQAWKATTGVTLSEEDLEKFITENEDHFSGQHKNVSHILIATADPVTALPLSDEAKAAARKKAETVREKVVEGVDFGFLAENYSDDPTSAKNKGTLTTPVKKLGGGLDPAFQKAAWALKTGEVSDIVESKFGFHIIKCDKVTPGQRGAKDFKDPGFREWIVDEYETMLMKDWLNGVRTKAKVSIVPEAELLKIKQLTFNGK